MTKYTPEDCERIEELDSKVIEAENKLDCSQPLDMNEVCNHSAAKTMLAAEDHAMAAMIRQLLEENKKLREQINERD